MRQISQETLPARELCQWFSDHGDYAGRQLKMYALFIYAIGLGKETPSYVLFRSLISPTLDTNSHLPLRLVPFFFPSKPERPDSAHRLSYESHYPSAGKSPHLDAHATSWCSREGKYPLDIPRHKSIRQPEERCLGEPELEEEAKANGGGPAKESDFGVKGGLGRLK